MLFFKLDPGIISSGICKQLQNIILMQAQQKKIKYKFNKLFLKKTFLLTWIGQTVFLLYLQSNLP